MVKEYTKPYSNHVPNHMANAVFSLSFQTQPNSKTGLEASPKNPWATQNKVMIA